MSPQECKFFFERSKEGQERKQVCVCFVQLQYTSSSEVRSKCGIVGVPVL